MSRIKGAKDKEKRKHHSNLARNAALGVGGLAAIGGLAYLSHRKGIAKIVHPSDAIPIIKGKESAKLLSSSEKVNLLPTQEKLFPQKSSSAERKMTSSLPYNPHKTSAQEIPISQTTKMPPVVTDSTTRKKTFVAKAGAAAGKTKQVLDSVHASRRTVLKSGAMVVASRGGEKVVAVSREANPVVKAAQIVKKTKRAVKEAQDLSIALSNNGGKTMSRRGFLKGAKNLAVDYGKAHPKQTVVPIVKGYAKAIKVATDPVGHILGAQKLSGLSALMLKIGSATGLYSDPKETTDFTDSE